VIVGAGEIAWVPATGRVELRPFRDPGAPGPGQVRVRTFRVGFCGTDREIARGEIGGPAPGADALVLGHEMVGVVEALGEGATDLGLAPGQAVVAMVRTRCGACPPCRLGRSDFCLTGRYLEHGITGLDGFARPALLVPAAMLVGVPEARRELAVLVEPLSVVIKALDQAAWVAARIPGSRPLGHEGGGGRAVVAGAGPIGLLATYLLTGRGVQVTVLDARGEGSRSAELVTAAGARYVAVARDEPGRALAGAGPADLAVEATGDAELALELLGVLGPGGVLAWLGVPAPAQRAEFGAGRAVWRAVLGHHAVVASVNSAPEHVAGAVAALDTLAGRPRFSDIVTAVLAPEDYAAAIWPGPDAIKQVVTFEGAGHA
jgi:glucose 1-dehydrogenase